MEVGAGTDAETETTQDEEAMTDPTLRPSAGTQRQDREWRSVIRLSAIPIALTGLVLMGNETLEQVRCTKDVCKLHLGTMLWGVGLFSLAMLVWQKGDVASSLKVAADTGTIVRGWFTRAGRATDPEGTKVTTVITPPPQTPGDP